MSALGQMVAGIAHEINNPVGQGTGLGLSISYQIDPIIHKGGETLRIRHFGGTETDTAKWTHPTPTILEDLFLGVPLHSVSQENPVYLLMRRIRAAALLPKAVITFTYIPVWLIFYRRA